MEPDIETSAEKSDEISIEDFAKIDMRTARILEAEDVEESNKLIRLKVEPGYGNQTSIRGGQRLLRTQIAYWTKNSDRSQSGTQENEVR